MSFEVGNTDSHCGGARLKAAAARARRELVKRMYAGGEGGGEEEREELEDKVGEAAWRLRDRSVERGKVLVAKMYAEVEKAVDAGSIQTIAAYMAEHTRLRNTVQPIVCPPRSNPLHVSFFFFFCFGWRCVGGIVAGLCGFSWTHLAVSEDICVSLIGFLHGDSPAGSEIGDGSAEREASRGREGRGRTAGAEVERGRGESTSGGG
eukprot:3476468-Rhodomonas_salina.2